MKTTCDKGWNTQWSGTPLAILFLSFAVGCGSDFGDSTGEPPRGNDDLNGGTENSNGTGGDVGTGGSGGMGDPGGTTGGADGGAGSGGATDPNAGRGCTLAWSSGFEEGFPAEWLNYITAAYSPDGTMPAGRVSAWTIVDDASGEPVYSGGHSYRGWIDGPATENHRAYPVVHTDIRTPVVNTFMVYLDTDYSQMSPSEWIHFGTWGNEEIQGGGTWALHTMSVRGDRQLHVAHMSPSGGEYIGPAPRPDFPLGRWVRLTVYIHYEGTDGFVQVWQDGVPMLRAHVSRLGDFPGTDLTRAHWGMYAHPDVSQGIQYNDDIRIWSLDAPLTDFETEPDCYLGR